MKPIVFLGDSLDRLRDFPDDARSDAGHQLNEVQRGRDPDDWKPIKSVGLGVREIRIRDESGFSNHLSGDRCGGRAGFACVPEKDAGDSAKGYRSGREPFAGLEAEIVDVQIFDTVFDALADTPAEAANLAARSELLSALKTRVRGWDVSQEVAAGRLGITRPRLNDLLQGKMSKFSLDALVNLATASGLTVRIQVADAA